MASPPTLDFDGLATPLAAPDPGAADLFKKLSGQFAELAREEDPRDLPPGDLHHGELKKADWPGVITLAREQLASFVKDLRIACWLAMGLAEVHRFAGLRDGVRLLRLLVEQCWNDLAPAGPDARARAEALKTLDDPDYGQAFPGRVRLIPVVRGDKEGYGYLHYRHSPDDGLAVDPEDFAAAVERAAVEDCRAMAEDIAETLDELGRLKAAFEERAPGTAVGLTHLRKAVEDCRTWVVELLKKKSPADAEKGDVSVDEAAPPANGRAAGGALATREQAYRQLREAAEVLGRLEPSSPVPCLVELAVQLEKLPFPQLMKALAEMQLIAALVRDNEVQEKLKRNLSG